NMDDNSSMSNLTLTYDFASARLLSSSTYITGEENIHNLYSAETVQPYPTEWYLEPYLHVNNEDISEELRLVHSGRGPWQWSVGAFYKDFREGISYPGEYFGLTGSSLSTALQISGVDARSSSSSWAGFIDTSFKVMKRLT